jgi:tight adherence protein B
MSLIVILVFVALFALFVMLMTVLMPKTSTQAQATLDAAIRPVSTFRAEDFLDVRKISTLSAIPWVHKLLSHMNLAVELRTMLTQADLSWTTGRLLLSCAAAWVVAGYLIALRTGSSGMGILLGVIAGAMPILYVWRKRQSRLSQIQQQLPDVLDVMVSALRAGQSMTAAFHGAAKEAAEPIGRELRLCSEEQNYGVDLRTALDNLRTRVPLPDVRMMAVALIIHRESGGNLAEVLDKTGTVMRDRARIQAQIRVQTAQGRLTGWVLSLLPFGLAFAIYILSPSYINVLLDRPIGHKLIGAGMGMNLVGLLLIRRIVNIRV